MRYSHMGDGFAISLPLSVQINLLAFQNFLGLEEGAVLPTPLPPYRQIEIRVHEVRHPLALFRMLLI